MPGYYRKYATKGKKKTADGTPTTVIKTIKSAPCAGDPDSIDWFACDCGYARPTSNGKPVPQRLDPAYGWTENPGRGKKPALLTAVRQRALKIYGLGYFHSGISIFEDPGFPDVFLWSPKTRQLMIRELKAMNGVWQAGQKDHLMSLQEAGINVAVWKPCCLLSGLVDQELAELAGMAAQGMYARVSPGAPNRHLTWEDVSNGALDEAS